MDKQDGCKKGGELDFPKVINSDTPFSEGRLQKLIFLGYTKSGAKYQCPKGVVFRATLLGDGKVQLFYP